MVIKSSTSIFLSALLRRPNLSTLECKRMSINTQRLKWFKLAIDTTVIRSFALVMVMAHYVKRELETVLYVSEIDKRLAGTQSAILIQRSPVLSRDYANI